MGEIADYHVDQYASGRWGMPHHTKRRNVQMTEQANPSRVVTGEVRLSYVNLLKPRESQFGGEPKYSVTILLPKSDVATKARIDAAIETAKQRGKTEKWNGVIPPMVAVPIHDGDGVKPNDGTPYGEECKGHWVINASSGVDHPPKIVDVNLNPVIDPTEVYSGMYARIAINFGPYANAGKKGVGCYLSTNVQKTRDGEPLGASAPDAASDFGGAPAPQATPQYQPQTYTHFQPQQPGQVYPAQQPQYQAPQYQPPAQPHQPQIDPITGLPINGGVYGI